MQTVVELPGFCRSAEKILSAEEMAEMVAYLARNPEAGALIPHAGGFRKIRWSRQGMGKRGGVRVIYFFADRRFPVFLARAYAKSVKENLTQEECKELGRMAKAILDKYRR